MPYYLYLGWSVKKKLFLLWSNFVCSDLRMECLALARLCQHRTAKGSKKRWWQKMVNKTGRGRITYRTEMKTAENSRAPLRLMMLLKLRNYNKDIDLICARALPWIMEGMGRSRVWRKEGRTGSGDQILPVRSQLVLFWPWLQEEVWTAKRLKKLFLEGSKGSVLSSVGLKTQWKGGKKCEMAWQWEFLNVRVLAC